MRLRYAGTCRGCGTSIAARQQALYDREAKNVLCLGCSALERPNPASTIVAETPTSPEPVEEPVAQQPEAVVVGTPGASARREHERRKDRREQRIRTAHPHLGGIILALTDDPQSTRAWDVGARGEERLGQGLSALADRGVLVLHDRRIPGTTANIDHVAVTPTGVYVIDAKRYKNQRPSLRVEGGLFRPRTEKLLVGGRDKSKLVSAMDKQVRLVNESLLRAGEVDVPVQGLLCFVDGDWPLIGGSFVVGGHGVLWPKKAFAQLVQPGPLDSARIDVVHRALAAAFPAA